MNQSDLTRVRIETLVSELYRRIQRFQADAERLGNVGPARDLLTRAVDAGRLAGRADLLRELESRLVGVLDAALASTPEPPTEGAPPEDRAAHHLAARRAVYRELEALRGRLRAEADAESTRAVKARAWVEQRATEVFAPAPSLRARVGQWLIVASARIAQRGAA